MDFIDEQNRTPCGKHACCISFATFNHLTHILHPGIDRTKGVKRRFGCVGDDSGKRCLADSRRPPQDERTDVAGVNHAAQHTALAHKVGLADVVVKGLGSKPFCERCEHRVLE